MVTISAKKAKLVKKKTEADSDAERKKRSASTISATKERHITRRQSVKIRDMTPGSPVLSEKDDA